MWGAIPAISLAIRLRLELARHSNGNMVLVQQLMRHESMLTTQRYMGWAPWGGTLIDNLYAA